MKRISTALGLFALLVITVSGQGAKPSSPPLLKTSFGKLPIYFIENRGVYPDEVAYYIQGANKTLFFTKEGITFRLKGKDRGWVVKLEFVGANPEVRPRGEDKQRAVFSYFRGPEKDWKTGLPTFAKVVYEDFWPGIDLVYRGTVNKLKYEFVVKPGADPVKIRLRYQGASETSVTESGGLRIETPADSFEDAPPEAWQEIGGKRVPVAMAYAFGEGRKFGFDIGDYDETRPIVLDPAILVYCGYIGGASRDEGRGIAVDAFGNAYVTGLTLSNPQTFPAKVGPALTHRGSYDAFVAKVNRQGTGLVYCGYMGGAASDSGMAIAVDASGNAYVTGETSSDQQTFPVMKGPDVTYNGRLDAFVAKVNPKGTRLVYCGYIGGASVESGAGIAVDPGGNAYVTGLATSNEQTFPVTIGPDVTHNGGVYDAFIAKVNAQGTGLVYCGYIGGADIDFGHGIAVDAVGSAYVTGDTRSNAQTFPVVKGPDLTYNGAIYDAFVAKVNPKGTGLVYCGYIGGADIDFGRGIAVDPLGHAYVTGETASKEQTFPVKVGPDLTFNGPPAMDFDAFVAKVGLNGTGLAYCGYIGGTVCEGGHSIAVDQAGNAYVTGYTGSDEQSFPVTGDLDATYNGPWDGFAAKVNASGSGLAYCGYIGGSLTDVSWSIAVDAVGNAYVAGGTQSSEQTFPVTVGSDLTHNGGDDAFVAKISVVILLGSGTLRPGNTVNLTLTTTNDAGLIYQAGSSLATGPIIIDNRHLGLSHDNLLVVSVTGLWPLIFSGYQGVINSKGQANAAINIPNDPALIGLQIHTAFVTLDPAAPSGIRSISNTFSFSITK